MNKAVLLTLLLMVTLPLCAQSDAYLHYSQNPNLDVAFFEKLRIDDTTILDVTVILAKDSATLLWMTEEFNLTKAYDYAVSQQSHLNPRYIITQQVSKADPTCRVTKLVDGEYDFMSFSIYYRKIIIFHIQDKQQHKSVCGYCLRSISKKNKQQ